LWVWVPPDAILAGDVSVAHRARFGALSPIQSQNVESSELVLFLDLRCQ